jgi:hypothetical protein
MGFFQRPTLRTRDDKRTTAAELTLRASIYPLCLVTILFFLWYVRRSQHHHTAHSFAGETQKHTLTRTGDFPTDSSTR